MAEALTPPQFVMHGGREVLEAGAVHIEKQIIAIEEAIPSNPGLAFDLAKTLLESTCKTVLSDRGCNCDDGWDLPRLLRETLAQLRLVPDGLQTDRDVSDSLRKMAGGFQTAIQGICELRNTHGFASHGKEASFRQLESVQALLVARSADTIVNFLFRVHQTYRVGESTPPPSFRDNADFNDYIDEANTPVRIFELVYRPSEVLFQLDLKAYQDFLVAFVPETEGTSTCEINDELATDILRVKV